MQNTPTGNLCQSLTFPRNDLLADSQRRGFTYVYNSTGGSREIELQDLGDSREGAGLREIELHGLGKSF